MLANIKMNALGKELKVFPRIEGETVHDLVHRFYSTLELPDERLLPHFEVLVDGYLIDKTQWKEYIPNKDSSVIIALVPLGGSARGPARTIITVAIVAVATAYGNSAAGGGVAGALTGALFGVAASFATTAVLDSLLPLPTESLNVSDLTSSEDSQSYSISNQSNVSNKFGSIPKVFGKNRMYPYIAANPYTELGTDEDGEIVQYFNCIYDFGLGPHIIEEVKIGDTSFGEFIDAAYRLVDFNRPIDKEGYWDDQYVRELGFYKGDVTQTSVSVALNSNQNDVGADEDDYTVVRSTDITDQQNQEVMLTFVCPGGLYTSNTQAQRLPRYIELDIMFAEEGTENWYPYNNLDQVISYDSTGGQVTDSDKIQNFNKYPRNAEDFPYWSPGDISAGPIFYGGGGNGNVALPFKQILDKEYINPEQYKSELGPIYDGTTYLDGGIEKPYYYRKIRYGVMSSWKYSSYYASLGLDNTAKLWSLGELDSVISGNTFHGYENGATIYYGGQYLGTVHSSRQAYQYVDAEEKYKDVFLNFIRGPAPFEVETEVEYVRYRGWPGEDDVIDYPDATYLAKSPQFTFTIGKQENSKFRMEGNSFKAVYGQVKFTPKTTENLKIRVTRSRSYNGYDYRQQDELTWLYLTTRLDRVPISTDQRHTFLELRVKATDQLNGTINNLSAVATSVLDVYDGTSWNKEKTTNPAWVFAEILTGKSNRRAISKDRLDTDSLLEWAAYCDEVPDSPPNKDFINTRFESNHILDYSTTVQEFINRVTSAAGASLNLIGGKYGVLIDQKKTTPVQVFTPRNSWGFGSTRSYIEAPHALNVSYIDGGTTWEQREEVVYADGYDYLTATEFEDIKTFGCTNYEQAWRYGRYIMASGVLRKETITITTDFEYLVCSRGDYVLFQQDAMKAGGRPARVKTVVGNVVTIDDGFITEGGINYGYTVRRVDGIYTSTMTITDSTTAELDGELPNVGDLIVWGEIDRVTIDCVVKTITPQADLTAQITLTEKADAIFDAESSGTLPDYNPELARNLDTELLPPDEVGDLTVTENTWTCLNGGYYYYVGLSWTAPAGVVDTYEVYQDIGAGYDLIGYTTNITHQVEVDQDNLGLDHSFKVIGVAANGNKKSLGEVGYVTTEPLAKTEAPSDVENVYINVLNETLQLDWDSIPDCDTNNYLIRFSPTLTGTWSTSIPLQTVDRNTSLASFQARTGTYLIKAIDWNGNESINAATAITSIPNLVNLNVIEETNDFPDLLGNKDQVVTSGTSLLLQEKASGTPGVTEYYSEGYYYFKNFLDLGEIYTCRIQSLIEAEGYTIADIISNWLTLSDVTFMTTTSTSAWDVESQYRSTDTYLVMGEWVTMSAVDPISEGQQENWTPWRRFTIGDFTARIFQFRLKLISNTPAISPRIIDGVIRSDMPDRVESWNNIIVGLSGNNIVYSPAFAGPDTSPAIQVTQDDASQGDYYKITNKTLNGFTITMYDKTDTIVSRQVDIMVKGYGRKNAVVI